MEDKTLVCINCGKEFTFTEGEQEFYQENFNHLFLLRAYSMDSLY